MRFGNTKQRGRRLSSSFVGSAMAGIVVFAMSGAAGAASAPAVKVTPGPYHNDQRINVSVGPNQFFKPYSAINIIECADPGGQAKNLPLNVTACDGNTIQGNTILVRPDGSFSEHGYQLFALPNAAELGEPRGTVPACSEKQELRAVHRAEPGELHRPEDLVLPVQDLEVGQTLMNTTWQRAEQSIRLVRLRGALRLRGHRGHGHAGCRGQRCTPAADRHTKRESQRRPDHRCGGRAERLLHPA